MKILAHEKNSAFGRLLFFNGELRRPGLKKLPLRKSGAAFGLYQITLPVS
jgi:hypothetical protein